MTAKGYNRADRVADYLRRELALLIQAELRDPRVGMVSITEVKVSGDLGHARVFYTAVGKDSPEQAGEATAALNKAAGFLRGRLSQHSAMRAVPRLQFTFDASVGRGRDMEQLIDRALASKGGRNRRKGRPVDGILVLDKPLGVSSNNALQTVKRLFFAAKAGHTGSLDPLATGVLPLCFGEATKFSHFLLDADKGYTATFLLGQRTATGDAEGEVLGSADASHITAAAVERALAQFVGEIEQVPPMYSAVKHQGQPLYKLARAGAEVERKARRVTVHALDMLEFRAGGAHPQVDVQLSCSKGTYVRGIAEDVGRALGCGAHVCALRRTKAGPFGERDAVPLARLEALKQAGDLAGMDALLLPLDAALGDMPQVHFDAAGGFYIRQGQPVRVPDAPREGAVAMRLEGGEFLGVGEMLDDGRVAPRRLVANPTRAAE